MGSREGMTPESATSIGNFLNGDARKVRTKEIEIKMRNMADGKEQVLEAK
jgi:hypothetical protein